MSCQKCNSERVIFVCGKTDDRCSISAENQYAADIEIHGNPMNSIQTHGNLLKSTENH